MFRREIKWLRWLLADWRLLVGSECLLQSSYDFTERRASPHQLDRDGHQIHPGMTGVLLQLRKQPGDFGVVPSATHLFNPRDLAPFGVGIDLMDLDFLLLRGIHVPVDPYPGLLAGGALSR